uniref:Uncharacterized protein n=1 Tax=Glossina austeni TaxID=7395 RepID=A0A1A9VQN2_GLOAU
MTKICKNTVSNTKEYLKNVKLQRTTFIWDTLTRTLLTIQVLLRIAYVKAPPIKGMYQLKARDAFRQSSASVFIYMLPTNDVRVFVQDPSISVLLLVVDSLQPSNNGAFDSLLATTVHPFMPRKGFYLFVACKIK